LGISLILFMNNDNFFRLFNWFMSAGTTSIELLLTSNLIKLWRQTKGSKSAISLLEIFNSIRFLDSCFHSEGIDLIPICEIFRISNWCNLLRRLQSAVFILFALKLSSIKDERCWMIRSDSGPILFPPSFRTLNLVNFPSSEGRVSIPFPETSNISKCLKVDTSFGTCEKRLFFRDKNFRWLNPSVSLENSEMRLLDAIRVSSFGSEI